MIVAASIITNSRENKEAINISSLSASQKPLSTPTSIPSPTLSINKPTDATSAAEAENAAKAVIKTSKGDITIELFKQDAPNTVANFLKKSQSGFYNNLTFHRVEDWVIQGGDPKGNGTGGGNMPTELNNKPFIAGSVGVARGTDIKISNDSQFFITKTDAPWLNGQYANFGIVTEGMDIVKKIKIGDKILQIVAQ